MIDGEWYELYDRIVPGISDLSQCPDERLDILLDRALNNVGLLNAQAIMAPELLAPRLAKWNRIYAALAAEKERRA